MRASSIFFLSFLLSVSLISSVQSQEIFKCTGTSGAITLSDKPCPQSANSTVVGKIVRNETWMQSILEQKGEGIEVAKVSRDNDSGITTVEYYFDSVAASNAFMEQAQELSQRTIRVQSFRGKTDDEQGLAVINIENEKDPEPSESSSNTQTNAASDV